MRAFRCATLLAVALVSLASAQEDAATAFDRFAKACGIDVRQPSRFFYKHADVPPWREFCHAEDAPWQDWWESAQVWSSKDRRVFVALNRSSDSGDWAHNMNYCFRADGSLKTVLAYYNTMVGNFSWVRRREFDRAGKLLNESSDYYGLGESAKIVRPAEADDAAAGAVELPIFRRISEVPFSALMKKANPCRTQKPKRAAPSRKSMTS